MCWRQIDGQGNIPNHYRGDILSVILTLIIFTIIVVIHEFGHFFVAKRCNVLVEEFAVGMGPKILGKKIGETEYTIRILPLGGFCRMSDEKPENENRIGFNDAAVLQRIAICIAGPVMNFVLALIIMIIMSMGTGIDTIEILSVIPGSGAESVGIRPGDKIIEFDNHSIHTKDELEFYKEKTGNKAVDVVVKRNGKKLRLNLVPTFDTENQRYLLGVSMNYKAPLFNMTNTDFSGINKGRITEYISDGYWSSYSLVKLTALGFIDMITAKINVQELSGPIGVTAVVDDVYTTSVEYGFNIVILSIMSLMALLSANLGVINLLPLPAIDGGKILIYLIELITGYRLPKEKEAYISLVGFVLIMGFGIYIAFNDIIKLMG